MNFIDRMSGIVKLSENGRLNSEMNILESLLPSALIDWTPLNRYGYSERHALLFRLTSSIQTTVYDALRERRLKMTPSRFFRGTVTLWRENGNFRIRDHIELVDDIPQAFSDAFRGSRPWKLIIVDKKNLALLVCDSLLLPVLANAANIRTNSRFLKVPPIRGGHTPKTPGVLTTHFFHIDPTALKEIATKCEFPMESVLLTVFIQGIQNLEENFGFLLQSGSKAWAFESLPRDSVSRMRYLSRNENQMCLEIDASEYKVASLTVVKGNSENNLLWHLTSSSYHVGLSINVIDSDAEGLIINLSSNLLRKSQLQYLDDSFSSNLTYLMMTLKIPWPDMACLDAKLSLHFNALDESLSS